MQKGTIMSMTKGLSIVLVAVMGEGMWWQVCLEPGSKCDCGVAAGVDGPMESRDGSKQVLMELGVVGHGPGPPKVWADPRRHRGELGGMYTKGCVGGMVAMAITAAI